MADWTGFTESFGAALKARLAQIGNDKRLLTPTGRADAEKAGVAVPYLAYDIDKKEYYSYFNDRQVVAIENGELTQTTDVRAEIGKRNAAVIAQQVTAPDVPNVVNLPILGTPTPLASGGGLDSSFVPVDQPQPFAGMNMDNVGGIVIAGAFIFGIFKIFSGLLGGRK